MQDLVQSTPGLMKRATIALVIICPLLQAVYHIISNTASLSLTMMSPKNAKQLKRIVGTRMMVISSRIVWIVSHRPSPKTVTTWMTNDT